MKEHFWRSERTSMLFLCVWLVFGLTAQIYATATCYTANGLVAPNDEPCYPENAKHSLCCPSGSICSASKLCILPDGGQAHRGSCTDRRWGRECPHFCLSEHPGDDGLTGVNMTLCETNPNFTSYCCNDWTGRRCNCNSEHVPKVTMPLLQPLATIPSKKNTSDITMEEEWSNIYDIPWNTVGPILASTMGLCILSMFLYLARLAYIAKRSKDPTRHDSIMENGRRFSDFFWNSALDEKDGEAYGGGKASRADSCFSVGTLDSEFDREVERRIKDPGKDGKERKLSAKSVRFPIVRSKSTGARDISFSNPLSSPHPAPGTSTQPHEPIAWKDIWNRGKKRGSTPGLSTKVAAKLKERPGFKRQDTDVNVFAPPGARMSLPRSET